MRAQDVLADDTDEAAFAGVTVRKGTVGAFLANARVWIDPDTDAESRAAAEHDILEAVPALCAIGLFDVLDPKNPELRDLIAGGKTASRK
jgi:hypothetical protein